MCIRDSSRTDHMTMETGFGQTLALRLGDGDEHRALESDTTGLNVKGNLYLYIWSFLLFCFLRIALKRYRITEHDQQFQIHGLFPSGVSHRLKHLHRPHHAWVSLPVPVGASHVLVENLQSDTGYQFSVLAQNKLGSGPFSEIVTTVPLGEGSSMLFQLGEGEIFL